MLKDKILSASGGGVDPIYVDDVFSTWLYTGNSSTQTIPNGIDLLGKGGMVWVKQRNGTYPNILSDTVRGLQKALVSNSTAAEDAITNGVTFPNGSASSTGFVLGSNTESNQSGQTFASWTFREAEKFFDVVTYTGNGSNRTIAHNLGSVPGCIIVKRINTTGDWQVYHRSLTSAANSIQLNLTNAQASATTVWNSTAPTSTVFSVGTSTDVNASGSTYVAYLFAHNAGGFGATGNDNVISCGSFTPTGGEATINLGYEPQWLLIKKAGSSSTVYPLTNWTIYDTMRGFAVSADTGRRLRPNTSESESLDDIVRLTNTGFFARALENTSHIYIAIRRPHKPPTSGTQVFAANATAGATNGTATQNRFTSNFPVDLMLNGYRSGSVNNVTACDRLRGGASQLAGAVAKTSVTSSTNAEGSSSGFALDDMDGVYLTSSLAASSSFCAWLFRRAPGFFDIVCYTGNNASGRTVAHNLTVAPELMIVKQRSGTGNWSVYAAPRTATDVSYLNNTFGFFGDVGAWANTAPTASVFTVGANGDVNNNGSTFVAYLFASLPGISKVGSYTGNGSSQTINCGFAAGARFVLIKRTDSTGNWVTFDTARGIVSGNDPALYLNSTAAEVTGIDGIDPDSSGFIVNQESTFNLNVNAASYIFLAIA